jgi:hypothetical protein
LNEGIHLSIALFLSQGNSWSSLYPFYLIHIK